MSVCWRAAAFVEGNKPVELHLLIRVLVVVVELVILIVVFVVVVIIIPFFITKRMVVAVGMGMGWPRRAIEVLHEGVVRLADFLELGGGIFISRILVWVCFESKLQWKTRRGRKRGIYAE